MENKILLSSFITYYLEKNFKELKLRSIFVSIKQIKDSQKNLTEIENNSNFYMWVSPHDDQKQYDIRNFFYLNKNFGYFKYEKIMNSVVFYEELLNIDKQGNIIVR